MHLNEEEQAMLAGKYGKAKQWAIDHQLKVGSFFDAYRYGQRQSGSYDGRPRISWRSWC